MARVLTVGAAQLGPIQKAESRTSVVNRMLALVESANDKGCDLIVFTELSLTTFFPRWYMEDQDEVTSGSRPRCQGLTPRRCSTPPDSIKWPFTWAMPN
ncbi:MAG: hypothetical protein Ct9H300mP16_01830 [Pseudomonadota bacterium]|nr:MAG: hypothetical protein Ct9H300mP16_01830 [Pseudomonadota bacterium]